MTQVSRFPLSKSLEEEMFNLFYGVLADVHNKQDLILFLDDLLTPTEKIMLAKRLAIAVLLDKGYDQRTVHTIMKVSVATVNSVNFWRTQKGEGYRKIIRMLYKQKQWSAFAERLDTLLQKMFSKKAMYRGAFGPLPFSKRKSPL